MVCPLPSIQRDPAADAERDRTGAALPTPPPVLPPFDALLYENVLLVTVRVPSLSMPPPAKALLSEKVLFSTVAVPLL